MVMPRRKQTSDFARVLVALILALTQTVALARSCFPGQQTAQDSERSAGQVALQDQSDNCCPQASLADGAFLATDASVYAFPPLPNGRTPARTVFVAVPTNRIFSAGLTSNFSPPLPILFGNLRF